MYAGIGVNVIGSGKNIEMEQSQDQTRSKHSGGGAAGVDGKSARSSFAARSMRSRKLGAQNAALLETLSDQVKCTEATIDDLRNQVMQLLAKHELGWDVLSLNRQAIQEIIHEHRTEGGFVGMRLYEAKNLGKVSDRVEDVKIRLESLSRRVDRQLEDIESNQDNFSNQL